MNDTDHTHDSANQPEGRDPTDNRVSVLLGDRLCVKCGFNLHGQTITREEHYNMLSVRCPECFTIASLQEYPTLGPWAARFSLVLALVWVSCVLTLAFFTGLTFYASAEGVAGVATRPAARQIGLAFGKYREANPEPEDTTTTTFFQSFGGVLTESTFTYVDPDWLVEEDLTALTADASIGRYQIKAFAITIPLALGTAAWGVAWSVLLLHRRLWGKLLAMGIVVALATALLFVSHWGSPTAWNGFGPWANNYYWGQGVPAQNIAARAYGLGPALITVAIAFAAMIPGLLWGRVIVRWLVRLLLPPHLRGPLAVLWHVDGLPSPPTRGEFWVRG
jgi:hypothetical protein